MAVPVYTLTEHEESQIPRSSPTPGISSFPIFANMLNLKWCIIIVFICIS